MYWHVFINIGFLLSLIFNALLFIPQAIKLFRLKKSAGVSVVTFLGFNIIQAFTIMHAYLAKDKLLFSGVILAFISCGIVTFLAIIYRKT